MKGLLHRLAARAAGTATVVQSDARMPYAGDVGWADAAEPGGVPDARAALSPIAPRQEDRVPEPPRRGDSALRDASQVEAPDAKPETSRGPWEPLPPGPRVGEREMPPVSAAPPRSAHREAADAVPMRIATHLSIDAVEPAAPSAAEPIPAAANRRQRQPPDLMVQPAAQAAPADPPPLMPQASSAQRSSQPGSVPSAPPRATWTQPGPAATAAEETTEVHIHIGRIDVTAAPEPAPLRRRPASTPAPMSLEGYLARRGRA